ncbi:MAG: pyridoxamine 5'-phosphate oxidase family protein [Pseudomonadota bacterium]
MTEWINNENTLERLYGTPRQAAVAKVSKVITDHYRAHIEASPFVALASSGPEGLDCSPRGDDGAVVRVIDETTVHMPDWKGNDRIDTLRNIVRDPRVALMFLIPGSGTVIRVNGNARITADDAVRGEFERAGALPRTVIAVSVDAVYFQCARAVMRAKLWAGGFVDPATLPTPGAILEAMSDRAIEQRRYDEAWPARAAKTLW